LKYSTWPTKLPLNLSCSSYIECFLTHHAIKLSIQSSHAGSIWMRWPEQILKAEVNYMNKWSRGLWYLLLLYCLLFPSLNLWAYEEFPTISW
jgi:hypothetical protein